MGPSPIFLGTLQTPQTNKALICFRLAPFISYIIHGKGKKKTKSPLKLRPHAEPSHWLHEISISNTC